MNASRILTHSALLCAGLAAVPLVQGGQNLLVNGDFETENLTAANVLGEGAGWAVVTGDALTGWTIASGHSATVHFGADQPTLEGYYSVNTDGEAYFGANDDMSQQFATEVGTNYDLSFDWASWNLGAATLEISLINTASESLLYNETLNANVATATPTPTTVSALFAGTGGNVELRVMEDANGAAANDNEFLVDNFSVASVGSGSVFADVTLPQTLLVTPAVVSVTLPVTAAPDRTEGYAEALAAAGLLVVARLRRYRRQARA